MVTFINSLTGTEMLVADDRKEEYLAAGYKLAASSKAEKPDTVDEPKKAPVKKTTKKK